MDDPSSSNLSCYIAQSIHLLPASPSLFLFWLCGSVYEPIYSDFKPAKSNLPESILILTLQIKTKKTDLLLSFCFMILRYVFSDEKLFAEFSKFWKFAQFLGKFSKNSGKFLTPKNAFSFPEFWEISQFSLDSFNVHKLPNRERFPSSGYPKKHCN